MAASQYPPAVRQVLFPETGDSEADLPDRPDEPLVPAGVAEDVAAEPAADDAAQDAASASVRGGKSTANVKAVVKTLLDKFQVPATCPDRSETYEEAVLPQLPLLPSDPDSGAKYTCASKHKELGNQLFKTGHYAWALRTYLVGVQQLQALIGDPTQVVLDATAQPLAVAMYSNAAFAALKLGRHKFAAYLCECGMLFWPEGIELAKLLMRKAQAVLDAPKHSDPELAVQLLEQAKAVDGNRAVLELLQRAKKANKEKEKAADRTLFGGKGFGGARLAAGDVDKTDASTECEFLLRKGFAALLGTSADTAVNPYPEHEIRHGAKKPEKDAVAARDAFAATEKIATASGLRNQHAHALFGLGAASFALEDFRQAVDAFVQYFAIAHELREAADGSAAAFREPHLGETYAHLHCGLGHYRLNEMDAATEQLERYLLGVANYQEVKICLTDEHGNERVPQLEKELKKERAWMVRDRNVYIARRHLAHLKQLTASTSDEPHSALREAIEQLMDCLRIAPDKEQREEIDAEIAKTREVLLKVEQRLQAAAISEVSGAEADSPTVNLE